MFFSAKPNPSPFIFRGGGTNPRLVEPEGVEPSIPACKASSFPLAYGPIGVRFMDLHHINAYADQQVLQNYYLTI